MLSIDVDNLNNNTKPAMTDTIKYLDNAKDVFSTMKIPSDFTYAKRLNSISSEISNMRGKINSIKKWTEESIEKFKQVENDNISLIASLGTSASGLLEKSSNIWESSKEKELLDGAKQTISNVLDFDLGEFVDSAKSVGAEIASDVKSSVSSLIDTGAKIAGDIGNFFADKIGSGIDFVATKVTDVADFLYNNIIVPGWDILKTVGASAANIVIGAVKGIGQLVESFVDVIIMGLTGVASSVTGIYDGITYMASLITGNEDDWSSLTSKMWKNTMAYVAEDHVESAFNNFYKNTAVGQWLDENSAEIFKSDGIITNIVSGLGYVAGIVGISLLTFGVGGVAIGGTTVGVTAGTAGVAALAGTGKYTQEAWGNMRDSSFEGIKNMYEKGEITKEQYNSYVMIRNLTDEQWEQIVLDYKNGKISKEEFEMMKEIREMPDDWRTLENGLKGIGYGVANGVWEGIQWYVGGKLGSWAIEGSKTATSAVRVGVDTAFNAMDTPFRTAVDAIAYGKSLEEAWKDQGGWESVLTNLGIGLAGSVGGEVFDNLSSKVGKTNGVNDITNVSKTAELEFDDPTDFICSKFNVDPNKVSDAEIVELANRLSDSDKIVLDKILSKQQLNLSNKNIIDNSKGEVSKQTEPIRFKNESEIAEFFDDPTLFIASKSNMRIEQIKKLSDSEIVELANKLSESDKAKLNKIIQNQDILSKEDIEFLEAFAASSGPLYSAYKRGADIEYGKGRILKGKEKEIVKLGENVKYSFEDRIQNAYYYAQNLKKKNGQLSANEVKRTFRKIDIDEDITRLDRIIDESEPLKESIIVKRKVNGIYKDGDRILTYNVGDIFNEKGYTSFSVYKGIYGKDMDIELEIEIPKGTKARYIQKDVEKAMGYGQQELLLGRNYSFEIIDQPYYDPVSKRTILKARLMNEGIESNLEKIGISSIDKPNMNGKYYYNYGGKTVSTQLDLYDVLNEMKSNGMLSKYKTEAREIKMSDLYKDVIMQEHGTEHVDDVLFNAMYIGKKEGLNGKEMNLLIEAAKFHDCGRELQGYKHGMQGAMNSEKWLSIGYNDNDIANIQAAIEYHAMPDGTITEVLDKYNIPSDQRESVTKIANILKDADALDRARFPGNLDPQFLRTDTSKTMLKANYQIQELRGKYYLDNTQFDTTTKEVIDSLRNSGVSDYEISFWLKNYPNTEAEEQFAMPVWKNINSKMEKILVSLGG